MSAHCHDHCHSTGAAPTPGFRRALWIALVINAVMFGVEVAAGLKSGSVSLLADAIDFFGDAGNYALTLSVLGLGVMWRARAAQVKAASMLCFGIVVGAKAIWAMGAGMAPEPVTMGAVGALALVANAGVAILLFAFREGDANMRGVWLCTRNDAIGNVAVMLAALGVFGSGTAWPDLGVALVMAGLAINAGWTVMGQARRELTGSAAA
jgi:Co/Zn/Cd efflux system component